MLAPGPTDHGIHSSQSQRLNQDDWLKHRMDAAFLDNIDADSKFIFEGLLKAHQVQQRSTSLHFDQDIDVAAL